MIVPPHTSASSRTDLDPAGGGAGGPTLFRRIVPLLVTTMVNRSGAIGLSLLPALLVQRRVGVGEASVVMGVVKGAALAGTFLGGAVSDRLGLVAAVLLSFGCSAVGLGLLPWTAGVVSLCAFAALAQVGDALFQGPSRLLVSRLAGVGGEREAIGWLRGANNLGQIVCFSIGAAFTAASVRALLLFDAITSLLAGLTGLRLLPADPGPARAAPAPAEPTSPRPRAALVFWGMALLNGGYAFLYQGSLVAAPARFTQLFGGHGVALFSQAMVVNTALCAALSVVAARALHDPRISFPVGILLTAGGAVLMVGGSSGRWAVLAGALLFTLGEVAFAAVSQFVMVRVTPPSRRAGSAYGTALLVQAIGRIAGSALAFPFIVGGASPASYLVVTSAPVLALGVWMARRIPR